MAGPGQVRVAISVQIGEDMFHDHARTFNLPASSDKIYQAILKIAESMKPFCMLDDDEMRDELARGRAEWARKHNHSD